MVRPAIGVLAAAALLALLAGCAPAPNQPNDEQNGGQTMTPLEAKAELYQLVEVVKQYHQGDWEISPSGALPCVTENGEEGAQYLYLITTDGLEGDAQGTLLDAMSVAWAEAGFEPTRSVRPAVNGIVVTDLSYPNQGSGPGEQGLVLQLSVGPNAVTSGGQSRCVPGDTAELNGAD
jgi:hypothetical protein